jgi:hypothetical protein
MSGYESNKKFNNSFRLLFMSVFQNSEKNRRKGATLLVSGNERTDWGAFRLGWVRKALKSSKSEANLFVSLLWTKIWKKGFQKKDLVPLKSIYLFLLYQKKTSSIKKMIRAESSPKQKTAKEKKATLMVISLNGGSQSWKSFWKYFFSKCLKRPPVYKKNYC